MDIFAIDKNDYSGGDVLNDLKSVIWIERFAENGEFTIKAPPYVEYREMLPIGSLITHTDTREVMVVEDHLIDETKEDISLVVTGRSVDIIAMENRIVTDDYIGAGPWTANFTEEEPVYNFAAGNTWDQIAQLLVDFLDVPLEGTPEALPNFSVYNTITGTESPQVARSLDKFGTLAKIVSEMLASIKAGIRVERPHSTHPTTLQFVIHHGVDVSDAVQFSWDYGDIDNAKYFWSNRNLKNAAYIAGEGAAYKLRDGAQTGLDLRIMAVDASDWKYPYTHPLNPLATVAVSTGLRNRGLDALAKQNESHILEATVAPSARYEYGKDYNIGDLVHVDGNYDVSSVMRVTEYARTEDEDGESGFPTLSQV